METHQIKLRDIEFYWSSEYQRYELVKHYHNEEEPYYFTIAIYEKTDDRYEIRIVRPKLFFSDKDVWTVSKSSISFLHDIDKKE